MHDRHKITKKKKETSNFLAWEKVPTTSFGFSNEIKKKLFRKNAKSGEILPSVVSKASSTLKKIKNIPSHTTSNRKEQGTLGQQIPSFIATGSYSI